MNENLLQSIEDLESLWKEEKDSGVTFTYLSNKSDSTKLFPVREFLTLVLKCPNAFDRKPVCWADLSRDLRKLYFWLGPLDYSGIDINLPKYNKKISRFIDCYTLKDISESFVHLPYQVLFHLLLEISEEI